MDCMEFVAGERQWSRWVFLESFWYYSLWPWLLCATGKQGLFRCCSKGAEVMNPVHPGETIGDIFIRRGIKKGPTMNNLPDGCTDKEISDAGEAKRPSDIDIINYVEGLLPFDVDDVIIEDDYDGSTYVCICVDIPWSKVER